MLNLITSKVKQTSQRLCRPRRCSECQKTFQYPSQLQNHMMKHKDIRPYICSECGMEFIQSHHLKQHTLTHKVGGTEGVCLVIFCVVGSC